MKILLTGATGFIGSRLTRLIVGAGHDVYALVRKDSRLWRVSDLIPYLHLVEASLMSANEISKCLIEIQPEVCVHLAWTTVPGQYLSSPENIDLVTASLNLASTLSRIGCRRLVGIGTCFEYDVSQGYLSEDSPTEPCNLYAACKLSLHLILEQLARDTGMEVAWLRLFYQYGPFENPQRLVPSVIRALLAGQKAEVTRGEQIRDFMHVEDVAQAIWAVTQSKLCGPVNIGSGQPVSVRSIVSEIGNILGCAELIAWGIIPYALAEPMFICANNRHLVESTGWAPRYDLEHGLEHAVTWWRENGDKYSDE